MSERKLKNPGGWGWFLLVLLVAGGVWAGIVDSSDSAPPEPGTFHNADTTLYSDGTRYNGGLLPTFAPDAAQELTAGLAELEKAYGICFGWSLEDGSTKKVAVGSSRGPGVAANTCPRWLETQVAVGYTSDSSESPDGVRVRVDGSADFPRVPREEDFARLGVTGPALVEDPVGGTGHAALGLPLLMVESGALQAVDTPPPANAPTPKPLGRAGSSDFPLSTTLTLSGLGAGVVVCVVLGFWMRARARKKTPDGPPQPGSGATRQPSGQPGQAQPGYQPPQPGQAQPGQQPPQPGQAPPGYPAPPSQPGYQQPQAPGQQPPGQHQPGIQQPGQHQPGQQPWPGQQHSGQHQSGPHHPGSQPGQHQPGQQPGQQQSGQQPGPHQPGQQAGQAPGWPQYPPQQQPQPPQQPPGQQPPQQPPPGQQPPGQWPHGR
ncbi:hypothetical protein ACPZ19_29725 [Amycolatopsis lurida]